MFAIGSHKDNDLVVNDTYVSRYHCRISEKDGRWWLQDLDSKNGTLVNGLPLKEVELKDGATIRVGDAQLRFHLGASSPATVDVTGATLTYGMVAESEAMRRVLSLIERYAQADEPVLITAESGCGKELVARALHDQSKRKKKPFIALNSSALTHALVESELFGHRKGAFTGATTDREGKFQAADGGTLFFDELGELPLELQPKLLRALESNVITPIGSTAEIKVDARIVAATNRELGDEVAAGRFRKDLFHRFCVFSIRLPPLRERPEDIIPLARFFLRTHAPERPLRFDPLAEQALATYAWPGNIRELRNVIKRVILMKDDDLIRAADLVFEMSSDDPRFEERKRILAALEESGGVQAEAARILGVKKSTFHDWLKKHGIHTKRS